MTTVNGEDDVPVCLDTCSDTWEEEFFDNLGQEDQGEEQDEEVILSLEDIQLFLESRGHLQDAMQVGILWTIYLLYRYPLQNRPLFMISFNSNSSLFRISFNFVNTCYFFVICSFSPKKHHYKENLRDGTNLSTTMRSLLGGFTVNRKRFDNLLARNYKDELTKAGSALVEVLFFFYIFLQVKQKTVSSASLKAILKTKHVGTNDSFLPERALRKAEVWSRLIQTFKKVHSIHPTG